MLLFFNGFILGSVVSITIIMLSLPKQQPHDIVIMKYKTMLQKQGKNWHHNCN